MMQHLGARTYVTHGTRRGVVVPSEARRARNLELESANKNQDISAIAGDDKHKVLAYPSSRPEV